MTSTSCHPEMTAIIILMKLHLEIYEDRSIYIQIF